MGLWERGRQGRPVQPQQLRAHSDAGSQYVSLAYTDKLALDGIARRTSSSIGSVGDAHDNALMETINGLYKAECVRTIFHDGPHRTIADVEYPTAGWVDWFNSRRPLSILDHVPPVDFENAHYATLNREPQPAQERQETRGASVPIADEDNPILLRGDNPEDVGLRAVKDSLEDGEV